MFNNALASKTGAFFMDKVAKISPNRQRKIEAVSALQEKLQTAKAFFFTDYRGLTHKQLEDLRKSLKKVSAEFIVAKNTLLKLTIQRLPDNAKQEMESALNNPTAALLIHGDAVNAVKTVAKFIKNFQLPKIKIGFLEDRIATADDFKKLSVLPNKEILLATLAMRMKSPLYGLHYALNWNLQRIVVALNNIREKKK